MLGLFLSMASFVIGFIYRNIRESDRRKMGGGAAPGT
jgi:hypothetical protein|tara:strand:+ start:834 stop:944 length:111 start_codon:yes stop_codon:yes gene_type:complete